MTFCVRKALYQAWWDYKGSHCPQQLVSWQRQLKSTHADEQSCICCSSTHASPSLPVKQKTMPVCIDAVTWGGACLGEWSVRRSFVFTYPLGSTSTCTHKEQPWMWCTPWPNHSSTCVCTCVCVWRGWWERLVLARGGEKRGDWKGWMVRKTSWVGMFHPWSTCGTLGKWGGKETGIRERWANRTKGWRLVTGPEPAVWFGREGACTEEQGVPGSPGPDGRGPSMAGAVWIFFRGR